MAPRPNISYHGALVLQALARGYCYGFDIMDFTRLASGTVYPILRRYEAQKLVRSRWETYEAARTEARPRRRYYELTGTGKAALAQALERLLLHQHVFGELSTTPAPSGRNP